VIGNALHIQGREIGPRHRRTLTVSSSAQVTCDIGRPQFDRSSLVVDRTRSLDPTNDVVGQHKSSERQRRSSVTNVETVVSFFLRWMICCF